LLAKLDPMKLGKRFGRIGFVIGFLGAFLFYATPPSFFTFESHALCPLCPYIDILNTGWLAWAQLGLVNGLIFGLLYALCGFVIGLVVQNIAH
jgi:hypothetical protein